MKRLGLRLSQRKPPQRRHGDCTRAGLPGARMGVVPSVGQKGRQRPDGNESERHAKALNLTLKVMTRKRGIMTDWVFSQKIPSAAM